MCNLGPPPPPSPPSPPASQQTHPSTQKEKRMTETGRIRSSVCAFSFVQEVWGEVKFGAGGVRKKTPQRLRHTVHFIPTQVRSPGRTEVRRR
ncbi:hypothetical protein SAY86_031478 [Trapa natans]|uniref:Uncharacterized protein n=1 Tax=Trapa natans TaxID=22666 RepID=A0AAN7M7N6_TRANT|nr:hypothetical protein SAY86_031478 [Trapa natans]